MNVIKVKNVNQALHEGLWLLRTIGVREDSRNGPVLVAPGPVATIYTHPWERVLFHPGRDANPVFHLVEALWMLAGRDTVADISPFNSGIARYAEDNGRIHGAYGHRWRNRFQIDQVLGVIKELKTSPNSRRAVMGMWSPHIDLGADKRDLPCNTHAYFDLRGGKLNMTVCCRSNDIIWGAYGANAVHFSILQELIAVGVDAPIGEYIQFSNNYHAYTENEVYKRLDPIEADGPDPYRDPAIRWRPLLAEGGTVEQFLRDCEDMFDWPASRYRTAFFNEVASPLARNYLARKAGGRMMPVASCDWAVAFGEWCERRESLEVGK
jgi:hypothetical protein